MLKLPTVEYVDGPIVASTRHGIVLAAGTYDPEYNEIRITTDARYRPKLILMHELCHWLVYQWYPFKRHENRLNDWINKYLLINRWCYKD